VRISVSLDPEILTRDQRFDVSPRPYESGWPNRPAGATWGSI